MKIVSHYELAKSANQSYIAQSFSASNCEVLIQFKNDHQIFAIRGTEGNALFSGLGILDVIRDARFFPWHNDILGVCHAGFLKGALKIIDQIDKYAIKDMPIILTGHSMGAAIGLLIAIFLKNRGYNVVEYVGFACPRAFIYNKQKHNPDHSVRFPITIYRYENDIVPLVPTKIPFGYHHIVKLTQLGDGNGLPSILDHSMDNYEDFLMNDIV